MYFRPRKSPRTVTLLPDVYSIGNHGCFVRVEKFIVVESRSCREFRLLDGTLVGKNSRVEMQAILDELEKKDLMNRKSSL